MKIQVLCDNPSSWIVPFAREMVNELNTNGHVATLIHSENEVSIGEVLVLLSCEHIFKKLNLNQHNLVVHESALPKGKGWSPLTWQVLEGKNKIPVTLFEAVEDVDAGPIYGQTNITLNGTELVEELRVLQMNATKELIFNFLQAYPGVKPEPQKGNASFYPRRKAKHSKLDLDKNIADQFNLLRVCDNERYPAYFEKNGVKYILKIYKNV